MDHSAVMAGMFGRVGSFDPFMCLNLSGTCATTKLIQCAMYGILQCDVTRKFYKHPSEASDLAPEDLEARRNVAEYVQAWRDKQEGVGQQDSKSEWTPILYAYEIVKGSAKKQRDYGHMVFTDMTLRRFLLVMCFGPHSCRCGNPYHDDYDALTKLHADRWFSLCKYLHHNNRSPEWVCATYITSEHFIDPSFLDSISPPPTKDPNSTKPGIYHVTDDNFIPSLHASELDRINNMLAQRSQDKVPPPDVRKLVEGRRRDRPNTSTAWLAGEESSPRQCAFCERVGTQDMPMCSKCKLVRYCGRDCQRAAWKTHKRVCRAAEARQS